MLKSFISFALSLFVFFTVSAQNGKEPIVQISRNGLPRKLSVYTDFDIIFGVGK